MIQKQLSEETRSGIHNKQPRDRIGTRFIGNYSKQNNGEKAHCPKNVVPYSVKQKRRIEALLETAAAERPKNPGPKRGPKWCPIVSFVSCEVEQTREAEKVTDPRKWVS